VLRGGRLVRGLAGVLGTSSIRLGMLTLLALDGAPRRLGGGAVPSPRVREKDVGGGEITALEGGDAFRLLFCGERPILAGVMQRAGLLGRATGHFRILPRSFGRGAQARVDCRA
jgi:hypothetical protein